MEIELVKLPKADTFILNIRKWLLPKWVLTKDREKSETPVKSFSSQKSTLALETITNYEITNRPAGVCYRIHICGICNAVCRTEPIYGMNASQDVTVYDLEDCEFGDQEWHRELSRLLFQYFKEDTSYKSQLERAILNIYQRYRREIEYYNENDFPGRNNIDRDY